MTLPVPPATLFKFARTLWFVGNAADVFRPHLFDYWQGLASSGDLVWMKYVVKAEDQLSTITADDAVFTMNVVNYTGGAIDTSWTDSDLNTVQQHIANYVVNPWAVHMSQNHAFTYMAAYRMTFADVPSISDPNWQKAPKYLQSGPPVKEWTIASAGQTVGAIPPQCSVSCTLETPIRTHWGRFYLPFPSSATVASSGRLTTTIVTELATKLNDLCSALAGSEFYLVIPSTQDQLKPVRALQQVSGVRVDDVFDTIRRRRSKYANFRARHDTDTP